MNGPLNTENDVLARLDRDHQQFADQGEPSLFGDAAGEVRRLRGEVKHWKEHAEEAGAGFAQVCRDAARYTARNVELVRKVEAVEALVRSAEAVQYRDEACRHVVDQPYADNRYVRLLDAVREAIR